MILPIATNNPAKSGNSKKVYVVGFAAFNVTTVDSNTHNATLLDDYITSGSGTDTWCRDCDGAVVIRLIWSHLPRGETRSGGQGDRRFVFPAVAGRERVRNRQSFSPGRGRRTITKFDRAPGAR